MLHRFAFLALLFLSCSKIPPSYLRESIFLESHSINPDTRVANIPNINKEIECKTLSSIYNSNTSSFTTVKEFQIINTISVGKGKFSYFFVDSSPVITNTNDKDIALIIDNMGSLIMINLHNNSTTYIWKNSEANLFLHGSINLHQENVIYINNTGSSFSYNLKKQNFNWKKYIKTCLPDGDIVIENEILYGLDKHDKLCAIDINTGNNIDYFGRYANNNAIGSANRYYNKPIITNDAIVYLNDNINIINKKNGLIIAQNALAHSSNVTTINQLYNFAPLEHNGFILVPSANHPFSILDARVMRPVKEYNFHINSPLVSSNNFVYFITNTNVLAALHLDSGSIKWTLQLEEFHKIQVPKYLSGGKGYNKLKLNWRGPLIINDSILVTSPFGYSKIIDINSGQIIKELETPECVFSTPTVYKEKLYFYTPCTNKMHIMN